MREENKTSSDTESEQSVQPAGRCHSVMLRNRGREQHRRKHAPCRTEVMMPVNSSAVRYPHSSTSSSTNAETRPAAKQAARSGRHQQRKQSIGSIVCLGTRDWEQASNDDSTQRGIGLQSHSSDAREQLQNAQLKTSGEHAQRAPVRSNRRSFSSVDRCTSAKPS
jgi:hypothetical protein